MVKEASPKYFLVLKVIEDSVILATLPSSIAHLPREQEIKHGCLEIPESCINCYIFEANKPITKCVWSFRLHTFLYGMWLDGYNLEILNANYQIENVDFEIIGELTNKELQNIINCFANLSAVKRRYRRILIS